MGTPHTQSIQFNKFKLKFKQMVQSKDHFQSMLISQHINLVSINIQVVIILVVMLLKFSVGVLTVRHKHHTGLLLTPGTKIGVIKVSSKSFVVKMNVVLKVVLLLVYHDFKRHSLSNRKKNFPSFLYCLI